MDVPPGAAWADAVSKVLKMGTNNPASSRILSKAKKDTDGEPTEQDFQNDIKIKAPTLRLKPDNQADALRENEIKSDAIRGVVHLFNAVKTVNPGADKKRKKKKKKKKKKRRRD